MDGTVKIDLWDGAVPYQAGPRRVKCALQKPLCEELDRLIKLKIIAPLQPDEKSEWCNSFVCVTKTYGTVRLCIDPSKLNHQIIHPVYNSRLLEDILPKFAKAKYFSIFDVK